MKTDSQIITKPVFRLSNGARKYDNLIKPDIVAPGNRLIGARAYYNGTENLLARTYPSLRTGTAEANADRVMYLSGTSMSAPIVAGAAMLLIQVNPKLTPNLIESDSAVFGTADTLLDHARTRRGTAQH